MLSWKWLERLFYKPQKQIALPTSIVVVVAVCFYHKWRSLFLLNKLKTKDQVSPISKSSDAGNKVEQHEKSFQQLFLYNSYSEMESHGVT